MSVVTSVVLKAFCEDEAIRFINQRLGLRFVDVCAVPQETTGTKYPQIEIYIGAFNHWDPKPFLEALLSAPWQFNAYIQLFVNGEDNKHLTEIQ